MVRFNRLAAKMPALLVWVAVAILAKSAPCQAAPIIVVLRVSDGFNGFALLLPPASPAQLQNAAGIAGVPRAASRHLRHGTKFP